MGVKTLVIDSIGSPLTNEIADMMRKEKQAVEVIDISNKRILPCIGCNNCWLKTPGTLKSKQKNQEKKIQEVPLYKRTSNSACDTALRGEQ